MMTRTPTLLVVIVGGAWLVSLLVVSLWGRGL